MRFPGRPVDDEETEKVRVFGKPAYWGAFSALLVAVWLVWPAVVRGAFVGRASVDAWGTQWFYDWAGGLITGETPSFFFSDALFYPWGKNIYVHTGGNVLDALLAWPFRAVAGGVLGYACFVAVLLLCNGAAVGWGARRLGAGRWGAALAGVLGVCNPFALHEIQAGRPTQALLAFAIVAVCAAFSLWDRWDSRVWAIGAVSLALTGLTYWFNALFVGVGLVLTLPFALVLPGSMQARRRRVLAVASMLVVSLILVLPAIWPMVGAWSDGEVPGVLNTSMLAGEQWRPVTKEGFTIGLHVLDLVSGRSGFFVPADDSLSFVPGDVVLPVATLVLLVIGAIRYRGVLRVPALVLMGFGLVLAVGPQWQPLTGPQNVLFVWIIDFLPMFDRLWWPVRGLVLFHCVAAVACAWVVADEDRRITRGLAVSVAGIAMGAQLALVNLAPFDTWITAPSETYACLGEASEGAVLELPYGAPEDHVFRQRQHGRPIFGGMFDDNPVFSPQEQRAFRQNSVAFKTLEDWAVNAQGPVLLPSALDELQGLGIRYILLDGEAVSGSSGARGRRLRTLRFTFREWLGAPVADDGRFVLYAPFGHGSPCGER